MLFAGFRTVFCLVMSLSVAWVQAEDGELRLRIARKLADQGQLSQALQEVHLHLAEHPESGAAYRLGGELLLKMGKKEEAAESYRKALAKDPQDKEAQQGVMAASGKMTGTAPAAAKAEASTKKPAAKAEASGSKQAKSGENQHSEAKVAETKAEMPKGEASKGETLKADAPGKVSDPKYEDKDFKAAIELYREGKKEKAQEKLRRVLGQYPGHAGAYYLGGVIRYEAGEWSKAAYNFKRSFAYPDRGYNAHYYLGRIYQKAGRSDEAIREFEAYAESTPSPDGKEKAQKWIAELRSLPDKSAGAQATEAKDKPKAKAQDENAMEPSSLATGEPEAHDQAGKEAPAQAAGEPHRAEPVVAAPPDTEKVETHSESHEVAPVVSSVSGLPMEDGFLFLIADSLSPSGRKMAQAHAYYRRERLEPTVQTLKETVRDFPGTENADIARLDLAAVYLRMQLGKEALNQLDAFAGGSPERNRKYFSLAYYLFGRAHLLGDNAEGAIQAERYFLKLQPDQVFGPSAAERDWQLAKCGEKIPDMQKRAAYFAQALATNKSGYRNIYLHLRSGLHEAQFGKPARAMAEFEAAQKTCLAAPVPEAKALCVEAQVRTADMSFRQKDWKGAMERYQAFVKAHGDAPDLPWAWYQIGNVHKAQARYDLALNAYQRVIDNFPDSYWAAQAKWQREDAIWQKEYAEVLD